MAENYLQHAEHYFRILAAQQAQMQQYQQQQQANGNVPQQQRIGNGAGEQPYGQQPQQNASAPSFSLNEAGMARENEEGEEAGAD